MRLHSRLKGQQPRSEPQLRHLAGVAEAAAEAAEAKAGLQQAVHVATRPRLQQSVRQMEQGLQWQPRRKRQRRRLQPAGVAEAEGEGVQQWVQEMQWQPRRKRQ
jgi:hypothetical protein